MKAILVSTPGQIAPPTHVSMSGIPLARRLELAEEYRAEGYTVEEV